MSAASQPQLAVCVTTYNQKRYIRDCLQSIVDQRTDVAFEVVVADDCSMDGTRAIVQEFGERYPGRRA
jgi:glycosyltransferase involved in cell wall biosynthesis